MRMYLYFLYVCQSATIEQNWRKTKTKHMWIVYSTSKTKHNKQILYCRLLPNSPELIESKISKYIIEIETKLFHFCLNFFLTRIFIVHAQCLQSFTKKVFTWIRVSFSISVFMFIFDPNKETIVNDVLQEIQRNHPNRRKKLKKKIKSNETRNVNWIQWFRGLDYVLR